MGPSATPALGATLTRACRGWQLPLKQGSCTHCHTGRFGHCGFARGRAVPGQPSSNALWHQAAFLCRNGRWARRQEPSWLLCKGMAPVSAKTQLESLLPQPLVSCFCVRQHSSAPVTKQKHPQFHIQPQRWEELSNIVVHVFLFLGFRLDRLVNVYKRYFIDRGKDEVISDNGAKRSREMLSSCFKNFGSTASCIHGSCLFFRTLVCNMK